MIKRPFFDEAGVYINPYEPVYLAGFVKGGTPRFHAQQERDKNSVSVFDNKESSLSKMVKDKTMVNMIRNGNASDKGIKREALLIERENNTKRKTNWLDAKKKNLAKMKKEFKIK